MTNIHATTQNDYSITVPCFPEIKDKTAIKLYVYRFHEFFDGLIGCDLIEQWHSKIDLKSRLFTTQFASHPIQMYESQRNINLHETIIPAQSTQLISVPTNISNGDILIDAQTICECHIIDCLSTAENSTALIEVKNPTQHDILFSLSEPITAHVFSEQTLPLLTDSNMTSERTQDVLWRLRVNHLNEEERANLIALCTEYSDIFHLDHEPLTFTNDIKHKINTTDEISVHSKTYRYPYVHREEVQSQIQKRQLRAGRCGERSHSKPVLDSTMLVYASLDIHNE